MTKDEALQFALETLEIWKGYMPALWDKTDEKSITAIKEALAQPEQDPVTVLPDGSAFAVMSFPLPKNHWLYAERQYNDGEYEPVELGKAILTHEMRDAVVSAVRYAIRGATNCGKENDFDPDALVQNAVYALCGPCTSALPQRTWVELRWSDVPDQWCGNAAFIEGGRWAEKVLKEKNT